VALTPAEIEEGLAKHGGVICGQTGDIVPADRLMYACRDETETVTCKELIIGKYWENTATSLITLSQSMKGIFAIISSTAYLKLNSKIIENR
jgi:hypothetical protein